MVRYGQVTGEMIPLGSLVGRQGLSWWWRVYPGCGQVFEDRGVLRRFCSYDQIPTKSHLRKERLTLDQSKE